MHIYHQQIWTDCGPGHDQWEFYDTIADPSGDTEDCRVRFQMLDIFGRCIMHCHILKHEDNGAMGWVNVARVNDQNEFVPADEADLTPTVPCILSGTGSACVNENNLPNDCTEVDNDDDDDDEVPNDPETEGPTQSPTKQPTSPPASPPTSPPTSPPLVEESIPVVEESIAVDCSQHDDAKKDCKKNTGGACIYDNVNKVCVSSEAASEALSKIDAEDPVKIMSSSSYRAGLKISMMLVGIFIMLWN